MNSENEELLNQGISAVRAGNKREGARILAQVVRAEPQSDEAWFYLAAATDQPGEAKACLDRVLRINPNHTRARQALEVINGGGAMPNPATLGGEATPPFGAPQPPSFDPYGSSSPYGANFPPPPSFNNMGNVPPPPFGEPTPMPPPSPSYDPYSPATTAIPAGAVNIPPPPPFQGGTGLRFGQLDPAAAAAAASQARIDEQAGMRAYDPGSEIRRSLLGENAPPPPAGGPARIGAEIPTGQTTVVKTKPRNNRRNLLWIALAALVLVMAAVVGLNALKGPTVTTVAEATPIGGVATTSTTEAATTSAITTAGVTQNPAAVTTAASATTALANTTTAVTVANPLATTATGPTATTAPAAIPAANPTTATGPTATAAPASIPTVARATTAAAPAATTAAPATTRVSGPAVTIVPPRITLTPAPGAVIPDTVKQYVNDANNIIAQMAFVESQINTIVVQPYKSGKITPGVPISKSYEVSYFTLLMGQLAADFRQLNPPVEALQLHQVGLDYASDIREAGVSIDRFFDTGRITYLEDTSNYMSKAAADRTKWFQILQAGYPFKVNF